LQRNNKPAQPHRTISNTHTYTHLPHNLHSLYRGCVCFTFFRRRTPSFCNLLLYTKYKTNKGTIVTSIRSLAIFSQYMLPRLACKAAGVINSAARSFAVRPFPAPFARRGFADTFTPIRAVVDCADPLGASPPVPLHDADMPPIDRRIGFMGSGQVKKRAACCVVVLPAAVFTCRCCCLCCCFCLC
jgi:hypothetical protein